jgi:hypothetical protein
MTLGAQLMTLGAQLMTLGAYLITLEVILMSANDAPNCGTLTDDCRGVIYNRNIFIIQATGMVYKKLLTIISWAGVP